MGFAHVRTLSRAARAAALGLLFAGAPARAHDAPYTYLDVDLEDGRARGTVMAHVFDLANAIYVMPPDSLMAPGFAGRHHAALTAALARRIVILVDGDTLRLEFAPGRDALAERRLLRFRFEAALRAAPGAVEIHGPLFPEDPQHETYVNVFERGALRHQDLLDASHRSLVAYTGTRQGAWAVVRTFVAQGIHHIFIGPDHVLFVVGLMLLGGSLVRLLKIVTAFTAAHSLTLAIAALGLFSPPARLVEPAIALSIVAVGVENLLARRGAHDVRVALAFGFGLVHGFGFASVLATFGLPREALAWSLFAFNAGVEVGQAVIVLASAPLLAWIARRRPAVAGSVVTAVSAVVIAAGSYWFVQRALGLP